MGFGSRGCDCAPYDLTPRIQNPTSGRDPPTMRSPFLDRLERSGAVLADGAMGSQIYARGISYERCYDELNLTEPSLIQRIHRDYIRAGAEPDRGPTRSARIGTSSHRSASKTACETSTSGQSSSPARPAKECGEPRCSLAGAPSDRSVIRWQPGRHDHTSRGARCLPRAGRGAAGSGRRPDCAGDVRRSRRASGGDQGRPERQRPADRLAQVKL